MITEPELEQRAEQPTVGIRTQVPMSELPKVIPETTGEAFAWLGANATLLEWGAKKGLVWDTFESKDGDGFRARYESYFKDPSNEPDPAKWETEVAIRLADG